MRTVMLPSYSVRATRRLSCSQDMRRPCLSRVWPLLYCDGLRKTLTAPVSSSQRMMRLLGISLQSRYRPSPNQTGPSAQRKPVAKRSTAALPRRYGAKRRSSTRMAGSGYLTGGEGQRAVSCPEAGVVAIAYALAAVVVKVRSGMGQVLRSRPALSRGQCYRALVLRQGVRRGGRLIPVGINLPRLEMGGLG